MRQAAIRISVYLLLIALGAPCAGAASIPHPHPQNRRVVHIIDGLEQRWRQAQLDTDTAVMANMLAEDYLGISSDGTLATRGETIAAFRSGAYRFTKIDTSDRHIRVYGTTAVVVSTAEVAGLRDGQNISGRYRYTRVYHRINHVWKIVSFEASELHERAH